MDTLELLHNCYLCRDLDQKELEALEEIVSIRKTNEGELLFFQGDPATGFYLLLSGSVRVY